MGNQHWRKRCVGIMHEPTGSILWVVELISMPHMCVPVLFGAQHLLQSGLNNLVLCKRFIIQLLLLVVSRSLIKDFLEKLAGYASVRFE